MAFGLIGAGPPTCTSREVVGMVNDMIRKSPIGASVQSIREHREISFDKATQIRQGQCLVDIKTETIVARYRVTLLNRTNGTFQVDVEPIVSADPPACNDPEVIALVEQMLRNGPNGQLVQNVTGYKELRFDRENKTRHGLCRANTPGWTNNVNYKVYWLDQKTGRFQVEIEP
jgi:hypothetical protein